ncbi:MAG: ABC transporter ATP-binding protein [Acidimicrobiia bacterium]|nr:MAG: ABC transporter ATP-binding protein [Acidimicrobiia bacterium]
MLAVENLQCSYGTARVLEGVDLTVSSGEVLALLGRNGMGKTTLARAIVGMKPPQIREGSITYRDVELTGLESHQIARLGVGYVPQGRRVFGSLTVLENLEVAYRPPRDGQQPWTIERVFEFFPRLAERSNSYARNLSGGEQQMLAIGRALATNPTLLVMDEPSEGLAPVVLGVIKERLRELKQGELTILLIEQNLGLALSIADRVVVLGSDGKIVWTGGPDELRADEQAKRRHLGV